ncbi:MAG TPA: TonB family protein [Pyrinomonadaceae bacterium]|nr:TonB family protein [Pyrinomonadaceae bacterium]
MLRQARIVSNIAFIIIAFGSTASSQNNLTARVGSLNSQPLMAVESDRVRDGLVGPVRRVRTEIVKLVSQDGRIVEGKRSLLEIVAYDLKGRKIENQYFPVAGATLTGKEVYKYDERGNISEMTLVNGDGTLLSKETYRYEFDFAGNWNKMTTAVAVVDGGRVSFEPTEVTYRSIMYYLDENMVRMVKPQALPTGAQPAPSNSVSKLSNETRPSTLAAPPNKSESQTARPSLPNAVDRVNEMDSSDAKALAAEADSGTPIIVMDSEPPSPTFNPIMKPVSGGVLNGTALSLPMPTYPDAAKRMRLSGVVSVAVVVDETGRVISAEPTHGPAPLRVAARMAALRARFSPTKLSGQPVKVSGLINYKFSLSQ